MSLLTLRENMRDTIAAGCSGFAQVDTHGGRFGLEELLRWAVKAPCVVVGALGIGSVEDEGNQPVAAVEWGAFVITKDSASLKRDAAGITFVEALLGVVKPSQRWGDTAAHMPKTIRATNLYSGQLDGKGVALWAVTWTQGYDINAVDFATLDDFLTYHATTTLADAELDDTPTSEDTVTLTGPV